MAANAAAMASILTNMKMPPGVSPAVVNLPTPPALRGALRPNDWLTRAQAYALNLVNGPESLVVVNRYIYTGLKDGWVVEIKPNGRVRKILRMSIRSCGRPRATEDACGRPLGIRADRQGYLVVADAYNGIFRINPTTGNFRQLVDARNLMVKGRPLQYINDLAVARDGTVFFTSSSTKWLPSQLLNILFEGETTGRVLVYNPREILAARRVQELVSNLHYPNGLQLSPDESFLLIGEGGRSRIHRAWIGRRSPKFGKIDTFAENLPGFVDNIRLSPRGTYWVGLSRARHENLPSVLDTYGNNPKVRAHLISLVKNNMIFDDPKFGIVVELDGEGKIVRSLQDPGGNKYTSVSEVAEENGFLFIASKKKNFIGIINLKTLPKPEPEPPEDVTIGGPGSHVVDLTQITDPNLRALLTRVKDRLTKFSDQQVRSVVLVLVKRLFEAKMQARRALLEVTRLRSDLERLQEMIGQSGSGSGSGGMGGAEGGGQAATSTTAAAATTTTTTTNSSPVTTTTLTPSTTTTMVTTTLDPSQMGVPPDTLGGSGGMGGSVDGVGGTGGGRETATTATTTTAAAAATATTTTTAASATATTATTTTQPTTASAGTTESTTAAVP
ncbi:adipocyte plasma membrane-associated protein-like [Babylonia areolata]|uniref:adipocyte plasma membrane-associated protein-like n=1 Tax=Babylonia areolata TaxID=304850 RepID=UPI003FCF3FE7